MMKRSFFGAATPGIRYEKTDVFPMVLEVPEPSRMTFLTEVPFERRDRLTIRIGDVIRSGQKIQPVKGNAAYVVASLGGTVSMIFPHAGNFGNTYTGITISVEKDRPTVDPGFREAAGKALTIDTIRDFLRFIPGGLPDSLLSPGDFLHTLVIQGADEDLLGLTRSHIVRHESAALKQGLDVLRKLSSARHILLTVPFFMTAGETLAGVETRRLKAAYPAANPRLVARDCLGITVPAGSTCADAGVCFISAEAVVSLGLAGDTGLVPNRKRITVIKKSGEKMMASARLGTPAGDVLAACGEKVNENDRLIFGGPMTGSAVFSEHYPVGVDTDIIMVQDGARIPPVADTDCVNCGECVRLCPARVPVNKLLRCLRAGDYGSAADRYDLFSCIECGLCAYVCPANIPVFQYIQLGRHELVRLNPVETGADHA